MKRGIHDLEAQSRQHKITDYPEFTKHPETPEPHLVSPSGAASPCDQPEQLATAAGSLPLGVGARVSKRRRRNADTAVNGVPDDVIDLTEDVPVGEAAGTACNSGDAAAAGTLGDIAAAAGGGGAVTNAAAVVKLEPGLRGNREQVEEQLQLQLLPFQQQQLCSWDVRPLHAAAATAVHAPDAAKHVSAAAVEADSSPHAQLASGDAAIGHVNMQPVGLGQQHVQAEGQGLLDTASLAAAPAAAASGLQSGVLAALQTALTAEAASASAPAPKAQQHEPQAGSNRNIEQPLCKANSSEPADTAAAVTSGEAARTEHAAAAAGAAGISTAAGLTVPQLKSLLQQACADKSDVKEDMVPVRYLAKLLHGQDVDLSTVQLAELLPKVGVLLQYMRDRMGGKVEGKSSLQPRNAAKHAKCMLRVLGLPEVQAVLGRGQQVQGLLDAVQAAQQEFQAMCSSSAGATFSAQPASHQTATEENGEAQQHERKPAGAGVRSGRGAAGAGAAGGVGAGAGAEAAGDTAGDQQVDTVGALSAGQLSDLLAAHNVAATSQRKILTTVKQLVLLVHGNDVDTGEVQLGSLLLQWPVLQEHLQQRMEGETGSKALQPVSALFYAKSVCQLLGMPEVAQQFSGDALQQLQQQLTAATATWKGLDARVEPASAGTQQVLLQPKVEPGVSEGAQGGSRASASSNGSSSSSEESDEDCRSSPAAHSLGLSILTRSRTRRTRLAKSARPQRSCAAAAAAAIASAAQEERTSSTAWAQRLRKAAQAEDSSALKPPAAVKPAPAGGRQVSKPPKAEASSAQTRSAVINALPESIERDNKQPVAATLAAAAGPAAAEDAPPPEPPAAPQASSAEVQDSPAQELQDNSGQGSPSEPAPGLSLQQLHTLMKQQFDNEHDVSSRFCAIRLLARLLHGGQYDPAAVEVGDLIRQWDVLEQHILQRVAGAIKELPVMAVGTALGYANQILGFTREPIVQAQLSELEVEQIQRKIVAAKGVLGSGTVMKVKARLQAPAPETAEQAGDAGSSEQQSLAGAQGNARLITAAAARSVAAAANPGQASACALAQLAAAAQASAQLAAVSAQVSMPATPAPASRAAAGSKAAPTDAASCPVVMELERNLLAAQRQLLWLYTHRLSPSLSSKLSFRSTMQMLAGLPPDDIRLDRFWADYDWVLVLNGDAGSQPDHWKEAFDTLLTNAARDA